MTLAELAFGCACYGRFTDYDKSYLKFLEVTGGRPDLSIPRHRRMLLVWLNQWGCRQFAVAYHTRASNVLRRWQIEFAGALVPDTKNIWELTDEDFRWVGRAYSALTTEVASLRRQGRKLVPVTFGPTGVSKILFALRRNAFVPLDIPIRRHFRYDGSAESYITYLKNVVDDLMHIEPICRQNGFTLSDLPTKLERPNSSVPKLIDEYNWLKVSKKWTTPTAETFRNWAQWCE